MIDAVLAELRPLIASQCGWDIPLTAETRIDEHIKSTYLDEFDFSDFLPDIEKHFGISISKQDMTFLSGHGLCETTEEWEARYGPLYTYGRLAELIVARMKLADIPRREVAIFGRASRSATTFRQIETLVNDIDASAKRFGPSTRIADRLSPRHLRQLWARLQIISGNRLPTLRMPIYSRIYRFCGRTTLAIGGLAIVGLGISALCAQIGEHFSIAWLVAAPIAIPHCWWPP